MAFIRAHNVQPAYGWIQKGVRKEIPANTGRARINLSGSIDVITHNIVIQEDRTLNLKSAVGPSKKVQDFESESLAMGVDHSLMVKATPIVSDYGSEDCAFLPNPTADSRIIFLDQQKRGGEMAVDRTMVRAAPVLLR